MSKLSPSKFCHCTQSSADAPIVALLWKSPVMLSCSTNNAYLDKNQFEMFYQKISAVQPVLLYLFSILRNFESNRGFLLRNSIELILKTWKQNNFDMFYKNYCWAVICYPICVNNVSYEREIIVLSFPVISFVIFILLFFRDLKVNLGFFFFTHTVCMDDGDDNKQINESIIYEIL